MCHSPETKFPGQGKRLTLRKNATREEKLRDKETGIPILDTETGQPITTQVSNRRAGYDFTFSVPKSVSLYLAVNDDKVVEELKKKLKVPNRKPVIAPN